MWAPICCAGTVWALKHKLLLYLALCTDLIFETLPYLRRENKMRLCVSLVRQPSDLWLKRVENLVFCVCVNPALVKLVSSVYIDQRLSYHGKALWGTRQAKLSVILIHWTKYQSASMTNKWSPTLKMCAALLLNPNKQNHGRFCRSSAVQRHIYVTMNELTLQYIGRLYQHSLVTEAIPQMSSSCTFVWKNAL